MNGYELSRYWFDWAFENPDLISPNDTALYLWLIEKNNRCGWSEKFSVTASESMGACGFKTYPPYKKSFDRLIEFGFVVMVKKSINQHQSNVVALSKNNKAIAKALDKASLNQSTKHIEGNSKSTFDINKQETIKQTTENKETIDYAGLLLYWNTAFKDSNIKRIVTISSKRKLAINAVLKVFNKEDIKTVIDKLKKSTFANGENKNNWIASFDFVFTVGNFTKVLEGNYDNKIERDRSKSIYG
jgi:hypothetical protein